MRGKERRDQLVVIIIINCNRTEARAVARQEFLNKSGVAGIFGPGTRIPAAADEVIDAIERALQAQEN